MEEERKYSTKELIKRFAPYFKKYKGILALDLFCAALTTGCELVLPLIMRYITNVTLQEGVALTVKSIMYMGIIYFVLRIIECFAGFFMANEGHIMGAKSYPVTTILNDIEEDYDKNTYIIVYCKSGNRSKIAAEGLIELGYKNVYDLGSINNWS